MEIWTDMVPDIFTDIILYVFLHSFDTVSNTDTDTNIDILRIPGDYF